MRVDDVASLRPDRYRSPSHRMPLNPGNVGSMCMSGVEDVAGDGIGTYCLPRHRMPLSSRNEGSTCVSVVDDVERAISTRSQPWAGRDARVLLELQHAPPQRGALVVVPQIEIESNT